MRPATAMRETSTAAVTAPIRFVLVRPAKSSNIGAAARALANFGFFDLVLLSPQCDPLDAEARRLSVNAEFLLRAARRAETWEDAVGDCNLVVGTSAQVGGAVRAGAFVDWDSALREIASNAGQAAVVFGPERTGLATGEMRQCHRLTRIPTADHYPEMNLAQSVAVIAYEMSRQLKMGSTTCSRSGDSAAEMARVQRSLEDLRLAVQRIGFLRHDKSGRLFAGLARLILRARPTATELDIVTGLARQIQWFAAKSANVENQSQPDD